MLPLQQLEWQLQQGSLCWPHQIPRYSLEWTNCRATQQGSFQKRYRWAVRMAFSQMPSMASQRRVLPCQRDVSFCSGNRAAFTWTQMLTILLGVFTQMQTRR